MKKIPGDIIILHNCTKNYDQMMYSSWDMVHDRCNCYFSFWAVFCPFTPLTTKKIKILKKWKKHLEISSFYRCVPKIMIRWYTVPEIWCTTDRWTNGWTDGPKKWHIVFSHGEARNIKFGQQVNIIQRVPLGVHHLRRYWCHYLIITWLWQISLSTQGLLLSKIWAVKITHW